MIRDWRALLGIAGVIVAALLTALVVNQAAQRDHAVSALIAAQHEKTALRAQNAQEEHELALLLRQVAALREQVRRMGGQPVDVTGQPSNAAPRSSPSSSPKRAPQPRPSSSPTPSHRPTPKPTPKPTPSCVLGIVCT